MTRTLEDLKEKNVNFWFRLALRFMAWGTLMVGMIWKIWIPWITDSCQSDMIFNKTEKWVFISSIGLILSIEGIKYAIDQYLKNKSQKNAS